MTHDMKRLFALLIAATALISVGCSNLQLSLPVKMTDGTIGTATLKVNNNLMKADVKSIQYKDGGLSVQGYSKSGDVETIQALSSAMQSAIQAGVGAAAKGVVP